ncbi:hypothetical protein BDN72DRAFT_834412 [Pluteus cervinus]|uniref:Uncharacterized protein n=1 Tax=Pluteus cervinus TaxID=181527 RepID=A0ACD3B822_9AGAR|nr:hypothetical protein BDN72DRAFT_834412 [Pluteus cervinus]
MSLASLPPELIAELAKELSVGDLRALRLVSRSLMHVVNPIVFESVMVHAGTHELDNVLDFFRSAAQGGLISRFSRSIKLVSIYPPSSFGHQEQQDEQKVHVKEVPVGYEEVIKAIIQPAVMGWTNATSIHIQCRKDPLWIPKTLLDIALQLPGLTEISYDHYSRLPIIWPSTPRSALLTRLSLEVDWVPVNNSFMRELGQFLSRFPLLESFSISTVWVPCKDDHIIMTPAPICDFSKLLAFLPTNQPPKLQELSFKYFTPILRNQNIKCLRFLTTLHLLCVSGLFVGPQALSPQSLTELDAFWGALSREGIHLRTVTTDCITTSFLQYLSSYSGLQSLELRDRPGFFLPTAGGIFVDTFIEQALPRHAKSLHHLMIDTDDQDLWNFSSSWAAVLPRCEALHSLSLGMDYSPLFMERFCALIKTLLHCALQIQSLRRVSVKIVYNNDDYNPPPRDPAEWPNANNPFTLGYHANWAEEKFIQTVEQFEVSSLGPRGPLELFLLVDYSESWVLTKTESDIWRFVMDSSEA